MTKFEPSPGRCETLILPTNITISVNRTRMVGRYAERFGQPGTLLTPTSMLSTRALKTSIVRDTQTKNLKRS